MTTAFFRTIILYFILMVGLRLMGKRQIGELAAALAEEVLSILEVEGTAAPEVEHIQDIVERVLMDNGYVQTAKAYILYRNERSRAREMNTRLMKVYEDITFSGTYI